MLQILTEQETDHPEWLRRLIEEPVSLPASGRRGECVLVPAGLVSFRLCTRGHRCHRCELYQAVEEAGLAC